MQGEGLGPLPTSLIEGSEWALSAEDELHWVHVSKTSALTCRPLWSLVILYGTEAEKTFATIAVAGRLWTSMLMMVHIVLASAPGTFEQPP